MKKIKCLALSMALVMGTSVSVGNFVSASGAADKAAAEMEGALSGDARYSRLSELVSKIEEGQKHYKLVFDTVYCKEGAKIPGFNADAEKEWANKMVEYSKELLELAISYFRPDKQMYAVKIAGLICTFDWAQKRMEEAADSSNIINCYGYADADIGEDVKCWQYKGGEFVFVPSLCPNSVIRERDSRLKLLNECISDMMKSAKELLKIVEESSVK